ncbi:hypothetical protein BDN70DRAFT_886494 [Pholiota conissans]|uniref:Uncharacterized protein n=1 Tax=Pholiota conissans TaxID=109636 RepID=A0A9P6CUR6_9AGAR|nr:hypothetical protein BDN70DRAFT_886494 [Pholiota conissans]
MNVCMTLGFIFGKGVQNFYGDMKEKRAIRDEQKRRNPMAPVARSSHGYDSLMDGGERSRSRKHILRKRGHNQQSQPSHCAGPRHGLGISNEARASAAARQQQRAQDFAVALSLRRNRRGFLMEHVHDELETLPPPQYDSSLPRLPNYEAIAGMANEQAQIALEGHPERNRG